MDGYVTNVESDAPENTDYRWVLTKADALPLRDCIDYGKRGPRASRIYRITFFRLHWRKIGGICAAGARKA